MSAGSSDKWTEEDVRASARLGWGLFVQLGGPHEGLLKIQVYDDPENAACDIFGEDENGKPNETIPRLFPDAYARHKVRRGASKGDELCLKAQRIVAKKE